jgi:hypothetical protein
MRACPRRLRENDATATLTEAKKALEENDNSAANHNNYGLRSCCRAAL